MIEINHSQNLRSQGVGFAIESCQRLLLVGDKKQLAQEFGEGQLSIDAQITKCRNMPDARPNQRKIDSPVHDSGFSMPRLDRALAVMQCMGGHLSGLRLSEIAAKAGSFGARL